MRIGASPGAINKRRRERLPSIVWAQFFLPVRVWLPPTVLCPGQFRAVSPVLPFRVLPCSGDAGERKGGNVQESPAVEWSIMAIRKAAKAANRCVTQDLETASYSRQCSGHRKRLVLPGGEKKTDIEEGGRWRGLGLGWSPCVTHRLWIVISAGLRWERSFRLPGRFASLYLPSHPCLSSPLSIRLPLPRLESSSFSPASTPEN